MTMQEGAAVQAEAAATIRRLVAEGYGLLRAGRHGQAYGLAKDACGRYPGEPALHELVAEAALAAGDPSAAVEWIGQAAVLSGHPLPMLLKQAELLMRLRRRSQALRLAERIEDANPAEGAVWIRLAMVRSGCQDVAGAERAYLRARSILGDSPGLLYDLATMQFFNGHFEQAEDTLDRLLAQVPAAGDALYLRSTLRRQDDGRNHVAALRQALAAGWRDRAARAACGYALAKELEDLGQHGPSYAVLAEAAGDKRASLDYDVAAECANIAAVREVYDAEAMAGLRAGEGGEGMIFIVGMPRTGTTLLERLLVERGGARSAGELMDFPSLLAQATAQQRLLHPGLSPAQASRLVDFDALGREYLRGAREVVSGHRVLIDKLPVNYLYCGMIAAALPRARILHLVRDPLDTCLAVYKTLFYGAYPFSYDLDELADYYLAYRTTMAHWHEVMPGRILDVHYEQLVAEPELQVRRVLEGCGLKDAGHTVDLGGVAFATASAGQVRGAIHTRSVNASRRHLSGLAVLVSRLAAAGVPLPGV